MHPAERQVARFPDLAPEFVGGKQGPADMVGAHEEDLTSLDHRDHAPLHPDILPDQRRAAGRGVVVILGEAVAVEVVDRMDGLAGLG